MAEPQQAEVCLDCAPADSAFVNANAAIAADIGNGPAPVPSTSNQGDAEGTRIEDATNPETFVAPDLLSLRGVAIVIEYCDRCRWGPRASWTSTELFLTFPAPLIGSITLMPCLEPAGRFRVWLRMSGEGKSRLMWDRKIEGGFPELKLLKQRIRNVIQPEKSLGHSDGHKEAIKEA